MYYLLNSEKTAIISGPHVETGTEVKRITRCGNPELLDLSAYDIVPEWREPVSAPFGWADPVIEERDGSLVVAVYAAGTAEEREAASFNQAKVDAQARRSALRLSHQTGGFLYDGNRYASDREESIPLLLNCVIAAQMAMAAGPEAIAAFESALGDGWRSTDGVGRITTAAGILALHTAFVAHGATCDRHSQALKVLIDAAESQAELDAIDIESGWPE
jgi:hypothetical protein